MDEIVASAVVKVSRTKFDEHEPRDSEFRRMQSDTTTLGRATADRRRCVGLSTR